LGIVAVALILVGVLAANGRRHGWAFIAVGAAIIVLVGAVFARMFPDVLPASNSGANALTIARAASQHNTLNVMTIVAAIFTPIVLAYQGWTYWVFRQRLGRPVPTSPTAARVASGEVPLVPED
jgi:cytochrome d ubiquinol oxidase subunit II